MGKLIRHVSELPEWFDTRPYEQWGDKKISEAVDAAEHNINVACFLQSPGLPAGDEAKEQAHEELKKISATPYEKIDAFTAMFELSDRQKLGEEKTKEQETNRQREREIRSIIKHEIRELLGDQALPTNSGIEHITLLDVHYWMEHNKDILKEIEAKTASLAAKYSYDFESVRNLVYRQVPLWDWEGAPYIEVCGLPTIKAEAAAIEKYLRKHRTPEDLRVSKNSEVRKLFEYKAVGYFVLSAWAYLADRTITKRCMANALFPEGTYDSVDMMPTKTVGRFMKRVEEEEYFLWELHFKAEEIDIMQN